MPFDGKVETFMAAIREIAYNSIADEDKDWNNAKVQEYSAEKDHPISSKAGVST